ncbi:MAG: formylglycine-generating enzyme family protein [Polyangiaceae bacterium]|nr:formylglycine-generating enzyme family protein [Polyangiaceae bacterium]
MPSPLRLERAPLRARVVAWAPLLGFVSLTTPGCDRDRAAPEREEAPADASLDIQPRAPAERKGMVWIPPGALVAGTPASVYPRAAEAEMPGEQVILKGFYIDEYPYPNEQGAIPLTNVSQAEAASHCEEQGKRLCSELEWERACKGPKNRVYEYGDEYRPEVCNTGAAPRMLPSGMLFGCRSEFGVRDLHGGVWEWTGSLYGRGASPEGPKLGTLRGGNATSGEVVGRCANSASSPVERRAGTVGFRCCAGPRNAAEVTLRVVRGTPLSLRDKLDKELAAKIERLLPASAATDLGRTDGFKLQWLWAWRPVANEELTIGGGCVGLAYEPRCGVLITRVVLDEPMLLGWASSGHWAPTLQLDVDARDLWLFGGDKAGQFKRLLGYVWGRVGVGAVERNLPKPDPKPKPKPKGKRR